MKRRRVTRDTVLFVMGAAGFIYETIAPGPPEYGLLPFFALMCGLPSFIKRDRRDNDHEDNHDRPGT